MYFALGRRAFSALQVVQPIVVTIDAGLVDLNDLIETLHDIEHLAEALVPFLFLVLVHVRQEFHGLR